MRLILELFIFRNWSVIAFYVYLVAALVTENRFMIMFYTMFANPTRNFKLCDVSSSVSQLNLATISSIFLDKDIIWFSGRPFPYQLNGGEVHLMSPEQQTDNSHDQVSNRCSKKRKNIFAALANHQSTKATAHPQN